DVCSSDLWGKRDTVSGVTAQQERFDAPPPLETTHIGRISLAFGEILARPRHEQPALGVVGDLIVVTEGVCATIDDAAKVSQIRLQELGQPLLALQEKRALSAVEGVELASWVIRHKSPVRGEVVLGEGQEASQELAVPSVDLPQALIVE